MLLTQERMVTARGPPMQAAGGHFTVDPLPEAGIRGNGHTMMLEKNNKVIMDRMVKWLRATVSD